MSARIFILLLLFGSQGFSQSNTAADPVYLTKAQKEELQKKAEAEAAAAKKAEEERAQAERIAFLLVPPVAIKPFLKLPGFLRGMTFGRSKGACTVLAFQDIPGLAHNYGADRLLSQELVGACENKGFLRITDEPTQDFASKQFGEHEVDQKQHHYDRAKTVRLVRWQKAFHRGS